MDLFCNISVVSNLKMYLWTFDHCCEVTIVFNVPETNLTAYSGKSMWSKRVSEIVNCQDRYRKNRERVIEAKNSEEPMKIAFIITRKFRSVVQETNFRKINNYCQSLRSSNRMNCLGRFFVNFYCPASTCPTFLSQA